jgi:hypothetical protein
MEVSGQLHALAALPLDMSTQNPLEKRMDGPQSWFGHSGEEKNSIIPPVGN